ncbi:hypothetical protein E2C01_088805 [Portunus trituberculatus]|uniref:Uncharacterized protein n=1 Tax=Portunus trituberculatus TaxID=210409 RepID=A0A5B7JKK2_PORTR|nr:hypothetical protein [Portunus trituberculatus]
MLNQVITSGLAATRVNCSSNPSLFSDHVALKFHYSASRSRICPPSSTHQDTSKVLSYIL